jgi:PAS domain-containing protein
MGTKRALDYDEYQGLAQALFEESGDALILFDPKTTQVVDVNAAAQRLCGIGLRDLLSTPVAELFRADAREGLGSAAFPARKVHLPYAERGCLLRTFQGGVWVAVDVTVTRLAVKPRPLVLLTLCSAPGAGRPADGAPACGGRGPAFAPPGPPAP